ncbi:transcription elongation factor GreA [Patescibacteria group bacterium]|jgi:transcription elongation factor GreA|nr:transcription elongation factor GreA [Patescibacteria group bacterium]
MNGRILTQEGLEKLQLELADLVTNKRKQVAERIKTAKEFGDLSENAEYQEAKEEQSFVEGRILELESIIKSSTVAETASVKDIVNIGSTVKVERDSKVSEFTIVGSTEGDPANNRISVESPLGAAFFGAKVGQEIEINLPIGKTIYKILAIK